MQNVHPDPLQITASAYGAWQALVRSGEPGFKSSSQLCARAQYAAANKRNLKAYREDSASER